ncbi:MAG: DUF2163 domain-containing protein [Oceanicaulis sp.]|uniref:DUF2163 domain-containing protein n=1 Tax=Glycocaulis sp. TaxID=1969725 RepID=UPI0025BC5DE5|nr:DUF2163 domain-containing protein [Glycocaulis sp.]MCC5980358.1 DUF2163 domain-containing protein [Oceanicaulis sp.]MCH8522222.1 DUF2163 domain-containing protein [Glycocaulis sp.]
MIPLPAGFQASLDSGVTTLCWCWLVTRNDGAVLGFTDHDRALEVVGVTCEPQSGFASGPVRSETGAPARGAAFGALHSDAIQAADIANGLYDGAEVRVMRVNWQSPDQAVTVFTGEIGEIRRAGAAFEAELTGLSARLNRRIGRVFARTCDAELGDHRCTVDLDTPAFTGTGVVVEALADGIITASGLSGFAPGWFGEGQLVWTCGANEDARSRVRAHGLAGDLARLELVRAPFHSPKAGDAFTVTAGCDGQALTCRTKFSNFINFRGCPHLPGNDVLVRHAGSEPVRDGGKR